VTQVRRGRTVTFHNGDADAQTVTSIPGDPSAFDLRLEPGATITLNLAVSGAYRYYCSIHATYDPQIKSPRNAPPIIPMSQWRESWLSSNG